MLSAEQNRLVTETGPGTSAGAVLRRYWQPAALTEELDEARPVKAVRLLGEDLVLFRDQDGRYGLIDKRCPHRGADLCMGRAEDGGLRCTFHGWLFDVEGKCLEQPGEPEGSRFFENVTTTAYPCRERNGIVFAYLGESSPPPLPDLDCFQAPDEFTFAFKGIVECNWLQLLEVGIDPAHASFLHRFFEDTDKSEGYGQQFRDDTDGAEIPVTKVLREYSRPEIEIDQTDYGLRIFARRYIDEARTHVRVTNLIFPQAIVIPMSNDMVISQWHVPIDDVTSWWYAIFTDFNHTVDKVEMRRQRLELYTLPDYRPRLNKSNNYGFDAAEQSSKTYTGMGMDINVHDQWAVESLGPVQDRSREQLGTTDKAISANRKILRRAIEAVQEGTPAPDTVPRPDAAGFAGPPAIDTMATPETAGESWREVDATRRANSAWIGK